MQLDVLNIDHAIARPFRLNIIGLKRPPLAGRKGIESPIDIEGISHRDTIEKARLVHAGNVEERSRPAQCRKRMLCEFENESFVRGEFEGAANLANASGIRAQQSRRTRNFEAAGYGREIQRHHHTLIRGLAPKNQTVIRYALL